MGEYEQVLARLASLESFVESLKSSHTIPIEVDGALRDRLDVSDTFATSDKTVASGTQAVNEGGAATYNVPTLMDGFLVATRGDGSVVAVPYYTP